MNRYEQRKLERAHVLQQIDLALICGDLQWFEQLVSKLNGLREYHTYAMKNGELVRV
jgi:uncharacterized protein YpiB (UPF0302 family)